VRFTAERDALAEELRICAHAVAKRDVIPIMKCVLLRAEGGRVTIAATDLDVTLVTSIPAEIEEEGACVVDFDVLRRSVVESHEEGASLSLGSDRRLTVTSGAFSIQMHSLPADDFPVMPDSPEAQVTAPWASVQDLITRVKHAVSDHDVRGFMLQGVLVHAEGGKLTAVATDDGRMSLVEMNGQPRTAKFSALIASRAHVLIAAIDGEGNAQIGSDDRFISFTIGSRAIYSRREDVNYPNYGNVIPVKHVSALIERAGLSGAIRRARVARSEWLLVSMDRGRVTLTATSQRGETAESVPCDYSGEQFAATYDGRYLAEAVDAMRGDMVALEFAKTTHETPLLLRAEPPEEDCEHIEVVMPRRM
jgi:DNA polymerase-3 subunit beta